MKNVSDVLSQVIDVNTTNMYLQLISAEAEIVKC